MTRSDLLRTTVTVPAGCDLTVRFWVRTITTEISRGDYLNVGLAATGIPPKTRFSLAFDGGCAMAAVQPCRPGRPPPSAPRRPASSPARLAGNGATAFDVDDVTFTLS